MRRTRILPGPRCGGPGSCHVKGIDHAPEPGTRRMWTYRDAELEAERWGPGGREHFGDPRPGDFPGRARLEAERELEAGIA